MTINYTEEQIRDITEREKKALTYLKELELTPSAIMNSVNLGNDVFATKVTPFLQDLKYQKTADSSTKPVKEADAVSTEDNANTPA